MTAFALRLLARGVRAFAALVVDLAGGSGLAGGQEDRDELARWDDVLAD